MSKNIMKCIKKVAPIILSCCSSIGVIASVALAVRATPKAMRKIESDSARRHNGNPNAYSKIEAMESAWKFYIPSAIVSASTIACILGAAVLNQRQQSAIAGAYALTSSTYQAYKDKVKELFGEEAHQKVLDEITKDDCKRTHITAQTIGYNSSLDFESENDEPKKLFYDSFSRRYFESTVDSVLQAEYHLNRNFVLSGGIGVNTFYEFLGIEPLKNTLEPGWDINDELYWIDFDHHKVIMDDGLECYIIDMVFEPNTKWLENL